MTGNETVMASVRVLPLHLPERTWKSAKIPSQDGRDLKLEPPECGTEVLTTPQWRTVKSSYEHHQSFKRRLQSETIGLSRSYFTECMPCYSTYLQWMLTYDNWNHHLTVRNMPRILERQCQRCRRYVAALWLTGRKGASTFDQKQIKMSNYGKLNSNLEHKDFPKASLLLFINFRCSKQLKSLYKHAT